MYYANKYRNGADPKPEKVVKPKKNLIFKKKPTGERFLFQGISDTRKHVSFISGIYLGEDMNVSCFAHCLPKAKNKYPEFKLNPKNIVLLTPDEHFEWDNGSREELRSRLIWQKMFDLEAELKEEYKKLKK